METDYEAEFEKLEQRGLFNSENVYDRKSFLEELRKNDHQCRIHYAFVDSLVETNAFEKMVQTNISNLKIDQQKKRDVVQDGDKFVIPKTKQVTYYRKGRKIQYYLAQKRKWNDNEIMWMRENRTLPTKLMLYKYYQNFGEVRSISSVMTKRRQVSRMRHSNTHMAVKSGKAASGKRRVLNSKATEIEDDN